MPPRKKFAILGPSDALPDATPPSPPTTGPPTLAAAVEMTERDVLVTSRAKIATELDSGVPAHALAPLIRQMRDLDREIRLLDARAAEERERARAGEIEDGDFDASAV